MESVIIPKNQLITHILVMVGVHELVHSLTSVIDIFAKVRFESSAKISVPVRYP